MIDSAARDPLIGSFFNNYRIDELLAHGGMGAVYLVRDAVLPNIRKVLKVILPELANNAFIKERFLREAEAVSVLKHPNIVGIDAIGTLANGRLCMLIPFLEGKPLDQFIAEHGGRLAPHRVMHIVAHIARGLDYAHHQGFVHRDLKPGNVFVEPNEDDRYFCKVLDFGIAKQLHARSKRPSPTLAGPMGTPRYMAVEQYANAADVTPAADVFALAVMAWQMVTGHLPWGEPDPAVLYRKQLREPPDRPVGNHLSPEWETILRSALSPDPRLRPQSMRQLVQALASALPAIEPLFPSGAKILWTVARKLVIDSAHDDETVHNQSERPLGVIEPRAPTPNRSKLAALGLAATASACMATLALLATRGDGSSVPPSAAARPPIGSSPRMTASAAPTTAPVPDAAVPSPGASIPSAPNTAPAADAAPGQAASVPVPPGAASERRLPLVKNHSGSTVSRPPLEQMPRDRASDAPRGSGSQFDPDAVGGDK